MDILMIVIVILVLLALAAIAGLLWGMYRRQRTERLRGRYDAEYDHAVNELGDRRRAESDLADREKRLKSLNIRSLTSRERSQFADEWQAVQTRFVDEPVEAVVEADLLVSQVMETQGYPEADFEQRLDYISVGHPRAAGDYRAAHAAARKAERGEASTEDLRQAMIDYRQLFEELLEIDTGSERDRSERKQEVV